MDKFLTVKNRYSLIKDFLKGKGFFISPKEYSGKDKSKFKSKWAAQKKIDDFEQVQKIINSYYKDPISVLTQFNLR